MIHIELFDLIVLIMLVNVLFLDWKIGGQLVTLSLGVLLVACVLVTVFCLAPWWAWNYFRHKKWKRKVSRLNNCTGAEIILDWEKVREYDVDDPDNDIQIMDVICNCSTVDGIAPDVSTVRGFDVEDFNRLRRIIKHIRKN